MKGHERVRAAEFGFPGELRDRLVGAILDGSKTSTSSLLLEYELDSSVNIPRPGDRAFVLDSDNRPVAVIETTEVRLIRLGDVDLPFVQEEGEGFESIADWREAHVAFWESEEMRRELGLPDFRVDDDTQIVAERFRLIERLA